MKTESDETTEPTSGGDNVVRLPCDWLGPREELVPLEHTEAAAASAQGAPPRADDFWGEDSAALQDAWQAPDATGPTVAPGSAPRRTWRRDSASAAFASGLGWRRFVATVALFAALAAAGIAIGYGGGGATRPRSSGHPNARLAAVTRLHVGHARVGQEVTYRKPRTHRPHVRHPRVVLKHMAERGTRAHAAATSAAQSSSVTPTAAPADGSAAQQTTSLVANPTPQHEDSMVSAGKSTTGHPTGAGAPFAPGYIP